MSLNFFLDVSGAAILGCAASFFLEYAYAKGEIFHFYYRFILYHFEKKRGIKDRWIQTKDKFHVILDPSNHHETTERVRVFDDYCGALKEEFVNERAKNGDLYKIGVRYTYKKIRATPYQKFMRFIGQPLGLCPYCHNIWVTFAVFFLVKEAATPLYACLLSACLSHLTLSMIQKWFSKLY